MIIAGPGTSTGGTIKPAVASAPTMVRVQTTRPTMKPA